MNNIIVIISLIILIVILICYLSVEHYTEESLNNIVSMINNDTINTSNINTTNLIKSQNIESPTATIDAITAKELTTPAANIDKLVSKELVADNLTVGNIKYLYDTDARFWITKDSSLNAIGSQEFKCTAFGFYDVNNKRAVISTGFTYVNFNDTRATWLSLFAMQVNGIIFKCIDGYKDINNNSSKTTANETNDPMKPLIAGNVEMSYPTGSYKMAIDTNERWKMSLYPTNYKIKWGNAEWPTYVIRNHNADLETWGRNIYLIKFFDVEMTI